MLFRLGKGRPLDDANELGTHLTAVAPDHLEFIRLFDTVVVGKQQDKFIRNVKPHDVQPHASVRDAPQK